MTRRKVEGNDDSDDNENGDNADKGKDNADEDVTELPSPFSLNNRPHPQTENEGRSRPLEHVNNFQHASARLQCKMFHCHASASVVSESLHTKYSADFMHTFIY